MHKARAFASHGLAALSLAVFLCVQPGTSLALSELKSIGGEPVTPGQAAGNPPGLDLGGDGNLSSRQKAENGKANEAPSTVTFSHDPAALPEPVRKLREKIIEAATAGDPERLRPLIGTGKERTQIPSGDEDEDPIEALKAISGDADGLEVLAIILDLISTGYAHVDAGEPDEVFVWPYFAQKDIQSLTAPEKVELLRIVTAGDLMGMQEYGSYNFFQIGLTPDGRWKFLTAGD